MCVQGNLTKVQGVRAIPTVAQQIYTQMGAKPMASCGKTIFARCGKKHQNEGGSLFEVATVDASTAIEALRQRAFQSQEAERSLKGYYPRYWCIKRKRNVNSHANWVSSGAHLWQQDGWW